MFRCFLTVALVAAAAAVPQAAFTAEFAVHAITIPEMKAVFGQVESRTVVPARARIGGTIREIRVSEGSEVREGDVIGVVVDDKMALQLAAADAKIAALKSEFANARTELERAEQLVAQGVATQSRLDAARTALEVATNQVAAAEADKAVIEQSAREGEVLTVSNLRHFRWRTEEDYDQRWETRRYNLATVTGADVFLTYWSGEAIAHLLVSFTFSNSVPLTFSIEVRREKGEEWSALAGFFRSYEMAYVAADERDIVGLRTNARREDTRLFRINASPSQARDLLLAYVKDVDDLAARASLPEQAMERLGTQIAEIARRERHDSHRLIEEFMLAANEAVARFVTSRQVPFIYRIHEPPAPEKLAAFRECLVPFGFTLEMKGDTVEPAALQALVASAEGKPEERMVNYGLLRCMKQARYSGINLKHFGLASDC